MVVMVRLSAPLLPQDSATAGSHPPPLPQDAAIKVEPAEAPRSPSSPLTSTQEGEDKSPSLSLSSKFLQVQYCALQPVLLTLPYRPQSEVPEAATAPPSPEEKTAAATSCSGDHTYPVTAQPPRPTAACNYSCSTCGRVFPRGRRHRYLSHVRTHTGERPYRCPSCGRAFGRRDHLQVHLRLHTGERPFQCSTCGAAFTHKVSLRNHRCPHLQEGGGDEQGLDSSPASITPPNPTSSGAPTPHNADPVSAATTASQPESSSSQPEPPHDDPLSLTCPHSSSATPQLEEVSVAAASQPPAATPVDQDHPGDREDLKEDKQASIPSPLLANCEVTSPLSVPKAVHRNSSCPLDASEKSLTEGTTCGVVTEGVAWQVTSLPSWWRKPGALPLRLRPNKFPRD